MYSPSGMTLPSTMAYITRWALPKYESSEGTMLWNVNATTIRGSAGRVSRQRKAETSGSSRMKSATEVVRYKYDTMATVRNTPFSRSVCRVPAYTVPPSVNTSSAHTRYGGSTPSPIACRMTERVSKRFVNRATERVSERVND
eukprot:5934438-Pyramimonas_sp.AAC.4